MLTIEQILKKYEKAKGIKNSWDIHYDRVFDYTMPSRNDIYTRNTDGSYEERREYLFTSVGEQSADEFVNRLQGDIFPIGFDWISLKAGVNTSKAEIDSLNKRLKAVTDIANKYKNISNFDTAISEFFYDLVAGTSVLMVLEGNKDKPLNFVAVPIKEFCIDEDGKGSVGYLWRSYKLKGRDIKSKWIEAENQEYEDDKEYDLLESVYKYKDKWIFCVIEQSEKKKIIQRESKESPILCMRWTKASGEVYGRGVGMKALRDLKTLNKVMENSLIAQGFTLPMFLAQQDGMLDVDNIVIEPGAVIPVPSTATGNPSITPLQINTNHDISTYKTEEIAMGIKKTMMASTLPGELKSNMTATEVMQRQQDLMINLGSTYGRLYSEIYEPLVKRIIEILLRRELIGDFDLNTVNGLDITVDINTPIALGQKQQQNIAMIRTIEMFMGLDPTGAMLQAIINVPSTAKRLTEQSGFPADLIFSEDMIKANLTKNASNQKQAMDEEKDDDATREIIVNKSKGKSTNE